MSDKSPQHAADWRMSRYSRQVLLPQIGPAGQNQLRASNVTLIGCGALGTVLADQLVRAGVGRLRIVDRDYVELNNLQRQVLFDETDVSAGAPKAVAAAQRLAAVNSDVTIEPIIADACATNIERFIEGANVLLDGTDNFETRFLINDVAVKHGIPWVYGACVGIEGMVLPILPRQTPCLRCIWDQPPPPGMNPTCDTAGVLGPLVQLVASRQAIEAIKILTGATGDVARHLVQINAWTGAIDSFDMQGAYEPGRCTCCGRGQFEYLAAGGARTATLCGRDAVQIPGNATGVDLDAVARRITAAAKSAPCLNRYLLRFDVDRFTVTLFRDGRAIIKGTSDPNEARTVYAKYIGQ
ncbi:Molybdopterin-synthase adenylyltransferase [Phycisphaerae bacterium RAS2]|nr:Molybdopterin-synthase adenylyltransferase [Phycisphaerae bacterium RAS2]